MKLAVDMKKSFPLLADKDLVYLDSSATTQKPLEVIERIEQYYREENANVHRAIYSLGEEATALYEDSRKSVQRFLGARSWREIVFTSGTTASINLLANSFCADLEEGDRILLTTMEHHSNLVPWQMAAQRHKLELDFIPLTPGGELDLEDLDRLLGPRTRLLSLTHVSNLLGTVNPVKDIIKKAHEKGIPVCIDAAQSAPRIPLDVQDLDCDFLAFSGHKTYGPTGTGILYGKEALLERLSPWMGGGDMISSVNLQESTWNEIPWKFEAGTPNIAGFLGLERALHWMEAQGLKNLMEHELDLTAYGRDLLSSIPQLDIYGPGGTKQLGVISFNIKGLHAHDSLQLLNRLGFALRAGHHCAQPLIRHLGVPSTLRASFGAYNSREDLDKLAEALEETILFFKSKGVL